MGSVGLTKFISEQKRRQKKIINSHSLIGSKVLSRDRNQETYLIVNSFMNYERELIGKWNIIYRESTLVHLEHYYKHQLVFRWKENKLLVLKHVIMMKFVLRSYILDIIVELFLLSHLRFRKRIVL